MALPERETIFVPGGLSQKHSQILGNKLVSERCSLCHPNSHSAALSSRTQDDLCVNCHSSHLPDTARRSPHDLAFEQLTAISQRMREPGRTLAAADAPSELPATTCALCHVEHHGGEHDIKAISDKRCQACHQTQFASFANGHPQFDGYPYRTQRRIAFDHAAHESKYFGQKNESFACARCHVDHANQGPVGSVFRTQGFDEACASCHAESIQVASANGWVLLQLPSVLPEDTSDPKLGLGDWPKSAQFDYDGEISVAMRLLMSQDAAAAKAMGKLTATGKISDISAVDRPEATRLLALATRRLVSDTALHGQAAWKARLSTLAQQALQRDLAEDELALVDEISAGLPPDLFRHIETTWFGGGGLLANRIDGAQGAYRLVATAPQDAIDALADDLESLASVNADEELLLGNADDERLVEPSSSAGLKELSLDGLNHMELEGQEIPGRKPSLTKLRGAQHLTQGGWYLDQEILAVRYMPRGHGDRTLAAWAEFVTLLELGNSSHSGQDKQQSPTWHHPGWSPKQVVPGGCNECHLIGIDRSSPSEWTNWKTRQRPATARMFTKFDHTPHLTLPTLSDCRHCHTFKQGEASMHEVLEQNSHASLASPSQLVATRARLAEFCAKEFEPMQRAQCVACHRAVGANDGCTQCHNYHVGNAGFGWSQLD